MADNVSLFNQKTLELLTYIKQLFKGHPKLAYADTLLRTAIKTNRNLPSTEFYYKLQEVPRGESKQLIDLIRECPEGDVAQALRLSKYIPYVELFDVSSVTQSQIRRIWCNVRELCELCGHSLEIEVVETPEMKRAAEFNVKYGQLLDNFAVAFPCEHKDTIIQRYTVAIQATPMVCCDAFRTTMMPLFSKMLQNPGLIVENPDLFMHLPFVCEFPLQEGWHDMVLSNEANQDAVIQLTSDLIMSSTGLSQLNSGLLGQLQNCTQRHMENVTDMSELQGVAVNLLNELRSTDSLQGLLQGLRTQMPNLDTEMMQNLASAVLPPELRATSKGFLTGSTGVAPFGAAFPNPGHFNAPGSE
jgi:hypothetical protein